MMKFSFIKEHTHSFVSDKKILDGDSYIEYYKCEYFLCKVKRVYIGIQPKNDQGIWTVTDYSKRNVLKEAHRDVSMLFEHPKTFTNSQYGKDKIWNVNAVRSAMGYTPYKETMFEKLETRPIQISAVKVTKDNIFEIGKEIEAENVNVKYDAPSGEVIGFSYTNSTNPDQFYDGKLSGEVGDYIYKFNNDEDLSYWVGTHQEIDKDYRKGWT